MGRPRSRKKGAARAALARAAAELLRGKRCELGADDKARGLQLYNDTISGSGRGLGSVAAVEWRFNVGRGYFARLVRKIAAGDSVFEARRPGRPSVVTKAKSRQLDNAMRSDRTTTTRELARTLDVSNMTAWRHRVSQGWEPRKICWKPLLSDAHMVNRLERAHAELRRYRFKRPDVVEVHLDEKWFYVGGNGIIYQQREEPPEYQHCGHKVARIKTMFLAVVCDLPTMPKIGIWPLEQPKTALRRSVNHDKGDVYMVNREVDGEFYAQLLQKKVFPALRRKLPGKTIIVQQDNAPPHKHLSIATLFDRQPRISLHPNPQCANSPETNVLDLSIFSWLSHKVKASAPKSREEVHAAVANAWHRMEPSTVVNSFGCLRRVHAAIVEQHGNNEFRF